MASQETLLNGRYRLLAQQASGGMAVVYKGQDLALGRIVAIKVLRPRLTSDPTFLARFHQEARNVANLSHPNIVTVHDFGQDGNTYYIVMEFIEGQDLKKLIRTDAPMSVDRALKIAIQICAGVGFAHRSQLVHADVKPQNVLITADDQVKVTDFGIAQALSPSYPAEKPGVVWGSPHYFAPEQASGNAPTPASDVYAIGIVMFEMLTGKLPYMGNDQQELATAHLREPVPHVMEFNPRVPVHLDRIIYKVMSKAPNDRYATADQLGNVLIAYIKQGNEQTINQVVVNPPPAPLLVPPPPAVPSDAYTRAQQPVYNPALSPSVGTSPMMPPAPQAYPPAPNYGGYAQNAQNAHTPTPQYGQTPIQPANPYYQITPPPPAIDIVSLVLGIIAFIAVVGLFPLWIAVLSAYAR